MKKKKGYALIFSIVVISILFILATVVLELSTSAYKNTKRAEESNKLKLVAESGIEKGNLILKNYILVNTNHTTSTAVASFDYLKFDPNLINTEVPYADLHYTYDGISCDIKFSPDLLAQPNALFSDRSTGRKINYIQIDATASRNGVSKTFTVVLDKAALKNAYFDQIFNSSITTADSVSAGTGYSADIESGSKLDISGNILLQGKKINLSPSSFSFNEGQIKVNTLELTTNVNSINDSLGKSIELYKNGGASITGWNEATIKELKVLDIKYPPAIASTPSSDVDPNPILDFKGGLILTDPHSLDSYVNFQEQKDPFNPTNTFGINPTLVTYKVENTDNVPLNFRKLIDGNNLSGGQPGVYKSIIDTLIRRETIANPSITPEQAIINASNNYGTFYKLILVKGDLDIDEIADDSMDENFVNYLIYCTGTVTFKGGAHFYNCSVFAKNVVINPSVTGKLLEFWGINTNKAKGYSIGTTPLSDFSPIDKMIINEYLIRNLDGYADSIEYKIVQWK